MLKIEQSVEVSDAVITTFWNIFCRDRGLEDEISQGLAIPRVSESGLDEQSESKEDLVSAFLKDRHALWMRWFEKEIKARCEITGGGLEIIAEVLQAGFEDPKTFGCAFINIVDGNDFDNESSVIAKAQKENLRRFIE